MRACCLLSLMMVLAAEVSPETPVDPLGSAAEAETLARIYAAQAGRSTVWVRALREERPGNGVATSGEPARQRVEGWMQVPGRYYLEIRTLFRTGEEWQEEERREWYVSDGEMAWHALREFADDPLESDPPRRLDPEDEDLGGFVRLVNLEQADLERRFAVSLAQPAETERLRPAARWTLRLTPRSERLRKHVQRIDVQLGEDFGVAGMILYDTDGFLTVLTVEEASFTKPPPEGVFTDPAAVKP